MPRFPGDVDMLISDTVRDFDWDVFWNGWLDVLYDPVASMARRLSCAWEAF